VWFDLVVPVYVFVYASELVAFLVVDAVEAFQFAVRLGMVAATVVIVAAALFSFALVEATT